jgi:hypothetical protein
MNTEFSDPKLLFKYNEHEIRHYFDDFDYFHDFLSFIEYLFDVFDSVIDEFLCKSFFW